MTKRLYNAWPVSEEIILDKKQYVTALKQTKISGTNDFVTITENVKWDVPNFKIFTLRRC